MACSDSNKFRSIRTKFFGIQFASILLTVVLVCGISLSLLSEYYADSQRGKLEAHAQALAIEAEQLLNQLSTRLKYLETHEFHRFQRSEVLVKSFTEHRDFFPRLIYFNQQGEQVVKAFNDHFYQNHLTSLSPNTLQSALAHPNEILLSVEEYDADFSAPAVVLTQARIGYFGDEFQGIIQGSLPLAQFNKLFMPRHLDDGVELVLTDAAGKILLHPKAELFLVPLLPSGSDLRRGLSFPDAKHLDFGQQSIHGIRSYYSYLPLNKYGWYAFAVAPVTQFDGLLQRLIRANIYLSIFGLALGLLLAHLMVRPILVNIGRIQQQTQNLAQGRLEQRVEVESCDELNTLADAVNLLTDKLMYASAAYDSVDLMLQTVIDPLIICDSTGAIIKTNGAAQELFVVNAADFSGQSLSRYFSQRSPLATRELLGEFIQQPQLKNYETEIQVAGGSLVPVSFSFAHGYEEDGEDRFIVCLFRDISTQKAAEAEISKLAYYDSLTGLPNRSLLHDRLEMVIRHAERSQGEYKQFAVLFLDLDHFKVVNDTLGHSIGDLLLQSAAQRLKGSLRDADTVSRALAEASGRYEGEEHVLARLGGDEFIVLLPMLRSAEDAAVVARQIIDDMAKPFILEGHEVVTPASIGLAIYPDDGSDSESLLRCADIAMYHAKEQGRNSFYFYSAEMNEAARERLNIEHHLRQDIENNRGFYLVYQPKVDLQSNRVVGMEVLVRWRNVELGEVSPVRFIPIAEDSGLIVPLGRWILDAACRQLVRWLEQGGEQLKIAVNLSGRQLKQLDLLPMVAGILHETGLDPRLLELELTESMLMETADKTVVLLSQLKQLGLSLAIDDFGTGYSSLSYLKRFPIDTLKIDRSFVRDLEVDRDDAAIIEAIIAMGRTLRMQVVAEGVETEMQFDFLRSKGAHLYQGFLFSAPVSAEEFARRFL